MLLLLLLLLLFSCNRPIVYCVNVNIFNTEIWNFVKMQVNLHACDCQIYWSFVDLQRMNLLVRQPFFSSLAGVQLVIFWRWQWLSKSMLWVFPISHLNSLFFFPLDIFYIERPITIQRTLILIIQVWQQTFLSWGKCLQIGLAKRFHFYLVLDRICEMITFCGLTFYAYKLSRLSYCNYSCETI